ncbi:hypothetical protein [Engelhardtia mirabilis]|uniref:Uncharacterized protein n=1 Tax=Engelhardtia mirabilis TaxID=2528011 RepID=A0A518BPV6_9BACT|nr:hypothetical protein Pla133_40880 [Planctomycetes bacterium Pla133]QDV03300.1 hypothetical protein Pla86_40870 [Planctomycetes bacterium Pla86]
MPTTPTHASIGQDVAEVAATLAAATEAGLEQELQDLAQSELAELKAAAAALLDLDEPSLVDLAAERRSAWRDYRLKLEQIRQFLQSLH